MEEYIRVDKDIELRLRVDKALEPRAVVVINHGFAEHIGRYDHVASYFKARGFTVYRYDLRGHGKTRSRKGYIDSYKSFISDCDLVVERARKDNPDLDIFMLGHSMGGLVTCLYGISHGDKLGGQIFSGPAVNTLPPASGFQGRLLGVLGSIFPHMTMKNVVEDDICSLEEVVEAYKKDPLVLRRASFKFLKEFLIEAPAFVRENIGSYNYPCLICHGEEDRVVPKEVGRYLYDNISSEDKELIIYPELYHEILNEAKNQEILETMAKWIEERL